MSPRLIPWCLAATGFVASLTVFTRQGELSRPAARLPVQPAVIRQIAASNPDRPGFRSSQVPAAAGSVQPVAQTLSLPLPPATQPEPDPNAQPVPDDTPTVDDLPARHSRTDSPADE